MMNFNAINDEANYYSELGQKTGQNQWNQDKFQSNLINMIESCNLTKEQIEKLGNLMVGNNAELDMAPSNNKSVDVFNDFAKNKLAELGKSKSII